MKHSRDHASLAVGDHARTELERLVIGKPRMRRDWVLARGSDMANIAYRGPDDEHLAAHLADCEAMVRSLRFT